jgi:2-keto-3-deoxy-6-phosphogluconate aldolase
VAAFRSAKNGDIVETTARRLKAQHRLGIGAVLTAAQARKNSAKSAGGEGAMGEQCARNALPLRTH